MCIRDRSGACEDEITVKKVEKSNPDYIFNKQGDVVNWFDRDDFKADHYSISDTLGELAQNEMANAIVQLSLIHIYYIFASMNLSVWVSEDLVNWESHRLPENLPLYDYAPDARVNGDYVYFCASKKGEVCDYYRTKDVYKRQG